MEYAKKNSFATICITFIFYLTKAEEIKNVEIRNKAM